MHLTLEGIYASMITPFDSKRELDKKGLRTTVDFLIENGIHGLLALGGTGEAVCLTDEECADITDIVVDQVNGKVPVVVGAIAISTSRVITLAKRAMDAGADGVMIVPPYFVYSTQQNVYEHFKAIAEVIDLPMVIFHAPRRTGVSLDFETFLRILEIDGIVGIKDSSRDLALLQELIRHTKGKAGILSGLDALVFATLAIGGKGAIITGASLVPKRWVELFQKFREGRVKEARDIQLELIPLIKALDIEPNPTPIKAALNLIGKPAGPVRPPLTPMKKENEEKLKTVLKNFDLLPRN